MIFTSFAIDFMCYIKVLIPPQDPRTKTKRNKAPGVQNQNLLYSDCGKYVGVAPEARPNIIAVLALLFLFILVLVKLLFDFIKDIYFYQ